MVTSLLVCAVVYAAIGLNLAARRLVFAARQTRSVATAVRAPVELQISNLS